MHKIRAPGSLFWLSLILMLIVSAGCGTLRNGRGWGENAFSSTSWEKISRSAASAFLNWQTLVPAAGALVFTINDYDKKLTEWAMEHRPIFGTERRARDLGDYIYIGFYVETLATALATPSGSDPKEWIRNKAKGLAVETLSLGATGLITLGIRETTRRPTPDGGRQTSFPSGHASLGYGAVTLSNRHLDSIPMSDGARITWKAANIALATTMAWARVEGGKHHPTDALFGFALGHFLNAFMYDAFMGLPENPAFGISVTPTRGGATAQIGFIW